MPDKKQGKQGTDGLSSSAPVTIATSPTHSNMPTPSSLVSLNQTEHLSITSSSALPSSSAALTYFSQGEIIAFVSGLLVDNMRDKKDNTPLVSLSTRLHALDSAEAAAALVGELSPDIITSYLPTLTRLATLLNLLQPAYALAISRLPIIQECLVLLLRKSMPPVAVISFICDLGDKNDGIFPVVVDLYKKQTWYQPITLSDICLYCSDGKIRMLISIFNVSPTWGCLTNVVDLYKNHGFSSDIILDVFNIIIEKSNSREEEIIKALINILSIIYDKQGNVREEHKNLSGIFVKMLSDLVKKGLIKYEDIVFVLNTIDSNGAMNVILSLPREFLANLLEEELSMVSLYGKRQICYKEKPFNLMGYILLLESRKANAANGILEWFFIKRKRNENYSIEQVIGLIKSRVVLFDILDRLPQSTVDKIFSGFFGGRDNTTYIHIYETFIGSKISATDRSYLFINMEKILDELNNHPAFLILIQLFKSVLAAMQIVTGYLSPSDKMVCFIRNNANHIGNARNISDVSVNVECLPSSESGLYLVKELMTHLDDLKLMNLLSKYFSLSNKIQRQSFYVNETKLRDNTNETVFTKIKYDNRDTRISPYGFNWTDSSVESRKFLWLFLMFNVFCYDNPENLTSKITDENKNSLSSLIRIGGSAIKNQGDLHGFLILFPWNYWPTVVSLLRGHIDSLKERGENFGEIFLMLANHEGIPIRIRFVCMHIDRLINPSAEKVIAINYNTDYQSNKKNLEDTIYAAKRRGSPLTSGQLCVEMLGGLSVTISSALSFFKDNPVTNIRQEIIEQIKLMPTDTSMFVFLDMMHYYQVKLAQLAVSGSQSLERYNLYLTMGLLIVYFNQELPKDLIEAPKLAPHLGLSLSTPMSSSSSPMDSMPSSSSVITYDPSSSSDDDMVVPCSSAGFFSDQDRECFEPLDSDDELALLSVENELRRSRLSARRGSDSDGV